MKEFSQGLDESYYIDLAQQDVKHFCYFYDKHYKAIYSFIYRRIQDEEITPDITSQVFLKGLQSLKKFKYKGIPFSAYLYRIASNEVAEHFRRTKTMRIVNIDNVSDMDELLDSNETDNYEEKINVLEEALKKLNEEELIFIEMRFFEKLSFKDIGNIKDLNENNAKMKIYRIIDKLRRFIEINKKMS